VLVGAEGAGLLEQAVHERGLAVVNVRDDGDISNVLHRLQNSRTGCLLGGKGQAKREGKFNCHLPATKFPTAKSNLQNSLDAFVLTANHTNHTKTFDTNFTNCRELNW
jgi:hypothetical protein